MLLLSWRLRMVTPLLFVMDRGVFWGRLEEICRQADEREGRMINIQFFVIELRSVHESKNK